MSEEAITSMTLLDRARSRDEEAWRRLVYLYTPLVVYWSQRQGVRGEDANDVAQEVFHAMTSALDAYRRDRPGDTFRGWLRSVTVHKALDWHRQRGRQVAPAAGGTEAGLFLGGIAEHSEGEPDDAKELSDLYRRGLELVRSEFEEKTWQAFWRVTVDGQATADVARGLGVTPATIRQAKARVLRRLKEELGDLIE